MNCALSSSPQNAASHHPI